ncbi:Bis(5'-nucleosyl)-tetraphosphatase, symmetrical [Colletotrichum spinosum]|uniref:Bis(5'-nucleosyl)-tetraphosphatase, symmetrical n=1 Tax=Colletotrichum spinosum TaxID=1347390 RepID=A0A4R8QIE0_9PEZI|nr:Bis(5'-nucleosyl)-tetraphosphatase, symmetrical [Colletotrichum spinosum]
MTFPAPARPRRGVVCVVAFFILATLFLAGARLTSFDLPLHRTSRKPAQKKPSPADAPMSYGTAARPGFTDMPNQIDSLPERFVPSRANPGRRLIIVGDVHGMRASLDALLDELHFDTSKGDHLVLAGDMINKGPDSRGVIDTVMRLGASAVRGNHEDRVLLAHRGMKVNHVADEDIHGNPVPPNESSSSSSSEDNDTSDDADDLEPAIFPHGDSAERATARSLSKKHLDWLATLPVILDVGSVESLGNLVVVHAGLVPGLTLKQQDPWAVMNMRGLVYPREDLRRQEAKNALQEYRKEHHQTSPGLTDSMIAEEHERRRKPDDRAIAIPTDRHEGASSWPKAWNAHQKSLPEPEPRTAVVYGHDSKKGLSLSKYSFGLDSGCVNDGDLTALVIESTTEGVTHVIKSVKCQKDEGKKNKKQKKSNR